MKRLTLLLSLALVSIFSSGLSAYAMLNAPDSAYIFAYSTTKNSGHNGLHVAWSVDRKSWNSIGPEYRFLFCDYGRWGAEKRMITPFLLKDASGLWHCVWSLNEKDGVFAHAVSKDLVYWKPQSYPAVMDNNNCTLPEVSFDKAGGLYTITWLSTKGKESQVYGVTTKDFKEYSPTRQLTSADRHNPREILNISGSSETGLVYKVAWSTIDGLLQAQQLSAYNQQLTKESARDDSARFKGLKPLDASLTANVAKGKKISDLLLGIFFEDINYSADGGLYAELVQNRDFEYALSDKEGRDKTWTSTKAWSFNGTQGNFTIDTVSPVHPNNKHYAVLNITVPGAGLVNEGFNGIPIVQGDKYDFSVFVRNTDQHNKKLLVRLVGKQGEVFGETTIHAASPKWQKIEAVLVANKTAADARLEIVPQDAGSVALDMISLFPQKTFQGHKNGLRADLAQTIADIHPRFMRFPGGCVAHGDGIGNIYRWKNTIGPLEARKPQRNLWGYHQTAGLGYFEYFQFCEDMGAEPLPVIAAGVPCQNSATGGAGQQGGVPMCDMDNYVQDILDLIEYANGDVKTVWGKKRAEAGHPKPFNLKMVGIGNEDLITDIFEERFTKIFRAMKEKHPEITVIGTVGPNFEGTDYVEGWDIATKLGVPMVDEHYYQAPGWFINNQNFYDKYDRSKPKVYLGEYASTGNTLYNALSEALYLTALERNGDVVSLASYAPLLAKDGFTQWRTDLIFFNNTEVKPTVNYYVQQLYGQNSGNTYLESSVKLSDNTDGVSKRIGVSVVRDDKTGDIIVKLANLLPVEVKTQVKLEAAGALNTAATQTVLSGKPGDKKATPVTSTLSVSDNFTVSLPAYSFTLICLKQAGSNKK
jgi:alpha-L-arabinofuranosidase